MLAIAFASLSLDLSSERWDDRKMAKFPGLARMADVEVYRNWNAKNTLWLPTTYYGSLRAGGSDSQTVSLHLSLYFWCSNDNPLADGRL